MIRVIGSGANARGHDHADRLFLAHFVRDSPGLERKEKKNNRVPTLAAGTPLGKLWIRRGAGLVSPEYREELNCEETTERMARIKENRG